MTRWIPSETGGGFELDTGAIRLVVTDQRDRGCGWCWHVQAEGGYGLETLAQGGGQPEADAAKDSAKRWAKDFCTKTIAGILFADLAKIAEKTVPA